MDFLIRNCDELIVISLVSAFLIAVKFLIEVEIENSEENKTGSGT